MSNWLSPGAAIEVAHNDRLDPGFQNVHGRVFYEACVINRSANGDSVSVRYEALKMSEADDAEALTESTAPANCRPRGPAATADFVHSLRIGQPVEIFYKDGWWPAKFSGRDQHKKPMFSAKGSDWQEDEDLLQASTEAAVRPRRMYLACFTPGLEVEVWRADPCEASEYGYFPARISRIPDNGMDVLVELLASKKLETVSQLDCRPKAPDPPAKFFDLFVRKLSGESNVFVDMRFDNGWRPVQLQPHDKAPRVLDGCVPVTIVHEAGGHVQSYAMADDTRPSWEHWSEFEELPKSNEVSARARAPPSALPCLGTSLSAPPSPGMPQCTCLTSSLLAHAQVKFRWFSSFSKDPAETTVSKQPESMVAGRYPTRNKRQRLIPPEAQAMPQPQTSQLVPLAPARLEAEAARVTAEEAAAEAKRLEAEAARVTAEEAAAEAKRLEAEAARVTAEEAAAEAERLEAEAARVTAEEAAAEAKRLEAEAARVTAEEAAAAETSPPRASVAQHLFGASAALRAPMELHGSPSSRRGCPQPQTPSTLPRDQRGTLRERVQSLAYITARSARTSLEVADFANSIPALVGPSSDTIAEARLLAIKKCVDALYLDPDLQASSTIGTALACSIAAYACQRAAEYALQDAEAE
eukprot:scaffold10972_cov127-Isochrysis_galbana.AAC.11